MSIEELIKMNTYQRFTRLLESIFDATGNADLNTLNDLDADADVILKQQLNDLAAEAAKLKSMGAMSAVLPEILVYHKLVVLVSSMAELLTVQTLTDTAVIHLSTVGVASLFVENISELQLSALR